MRGFWHNHTVIVVVERGLRFNLIAGLYNCGLNLAIGCAVRGDGAYKVCRATADTAPTQSPDSCKRSKELTALLDNKQAVGIVARISLPRSGNFPEVTVRLVVSYFNWIWVHSRKGNTAAQRADKRDRSLVLARVAQLSHTSLMHNQQEQLRTLLHSNPRNLGYSTTWTLELVSQACDEQGITNSKVSLSTIRETIVRMGVS